MAYIFSFLWFIFFSYLFPTQLPLEIIHDDSNKEVDEDEVLEDNEGGQVDKYVPVLRVALLHVCVDEVPVVQCD